MSCENQVLPTHYYNVLRYIEKIIKPSISSF